MKCLIGKVFCYAVIARGLKQHNNASIRGCVNEPQSLYCAGMGGGDKKEAVFLYTNMDKLSRQIIK